jgi:hypothetical protein
MMTRAILPKRPGLAEAGRQLWSELRSNRRAGLGLVVIAALAAAYGIVLLRGATAREAAAYHAQAQMLQRIAAIAAEHDWPQRAAQSTALLTGLQQRLWVADSEGLAQADLQAWIARVGREVGLPMLDIRVEAAKLPGLPADLRQITATVTAQPSETAVIALLEQLEAAPHLTVVSRLHLRQQPSPMLELVLLGYARIAK